MSNSKRKYSERAVMKMLGITFKLKTQDENRVDSKKKFIHFSYLHSKIQLLDYMQNMDSICCNR